jgi:uncharacterized protein with HEPN domain
MDSSDIECVHDILECIDAIDRAEMTMQRSPGDLDVARVALDAVRFRLLTIGAVVRSLSRALREDHPAVVWSEMERLPDLISNRDDISHDGDQPDPQVALVTVGEPLRQLRRACQSILGEVVRIGEDEP